MTQTLQYFHHIQIEDRQENLNFNTSSSISNFKDNYFAVSKNKRLKITEYKNGMAHKIYLYSQKGNLKCLIHCNVGKNNYHIKEIYDYTYQEKRLKEKRFYNANNHFLKKECYKNNQLKSINYYSNGVPYYVEDFDSHGNLVKSYYYHENGLKVK